jgi:hypothetical protein
MRSVRWSVPFLAVVLGGCGQAGSPHSAGTVPAGASGTQQPEAVEHDFGVIPHGEARSFDYVIPVQQLGKAVVPLRAQLDCSCGRAEVVLRHRNGTERPIDGSPMSPNAPTADETLVVRVTIDTRTKDPVDVTKAVSRGSVLLQPVADRDGTLRIHWPLLVRYSIDVPVVVAPFAELDFERVPACATPELQTTLRGDAAHAGVVFGPVRSSDPAITASLEPDGDGVRLRVRCRPGELGNHQAVLQIDTNLPSGYQVHLAVKWKVVPELEASPMPKLSFRADLKRPQTRDESQGQYLQVIDHDPRRGPEFEVRELVDEAGQDARAAFEVWFAPVANQAGQQRVFVRYLGGRPDGFRGRLVLAKAGTDGPFLPIELVAFHHKAP